MPGLLRQKPHRVILLIGLLAWGSVFGCAGTAPPGRSGDICAIFKERPEWYTHASASAEQWQVPIPILLAIMYIESGFNADARPPRTKCLFIFPGPRPSTAYGYPQALDITWKEYQQHTGNWGADRDDFEDAVDFIGWYCRMSTVRCGISRFDPYLLYLAYHEGHGGFNRGSYQNKTDVKRAARSVEKLAGQYTSLLTGCQNELEKTGRGCWLWPF